MLLGEIHYRVPVVITDAPWSDYAFIVPERGISETTLIGAQPSGGGPVMHFYVGPITNVELLTWDDISNL